MSGGDINAVLTQPMANGLYDLSDSSYGISDLTGIGNLTALRILDLSYNKITSIPTAIGNLSVLQILNLSFNQLGSIPVEIGNLNSLMTLYAQNNLLPSDYADVLNTIGLNFTVYYENQRQLELKSGLTPYRIQTGNDLDAIDLFNVVQLNDLNTASPSHHLILTNYVDENNQPVNIADYIKNGIVIKPGTLFAQVRATGIGLFPNTSDHALTATKLQLNFEISYDLSFDLNGAEGTVPATQVSFEGDVGIAVTDPIREGYTFKGWNTSVDGSGINWVPGTTPMIGQNVILHAQWQEKDKPPISEPKPEDNVTGHVLPKTGGYSAVLISLLILGSGLVVSIIGYKKCK